MENGFCLYCNRYFEDGVIMPQEMCVECEHANIMAVREATMALYNTIIKELKGS